MTPGPHLHVVTIVQARMGASRLPGKPLLEVMNRPLLSYLIERLKRAKTVSSILIATTEKPQDEPIYALAKKEGVEAVRGSEEDVLSRYLLAAGKKPCDVIVRITADCPLIDPAIIDKAVSLFLKDSALDYLSNAQKRTFPRGMDVEVFSKKALKKAESMATSPSDREHVTPAIWKNPDLFKLGSFHYREDVSNLRLTVDTKEDFQLIQALLEGLYPLKKEFSLEDILEYLKKHQDLILLNQHIKQKNL